MMMNPKSSLTPEEVLMMFDTNNDSLLSFDEMSHSDGKKIMSRIRCYDMDGLMK